MTIYCRILRTFYRNYPIKQFCTVMEASELAHIEVKENCNPFDLFKEWMDESKTYGKFNTATFNLATATSSGDVFNRTVVLADYKENTLIFITTENGKKVKQIRENNKVSACFLWEYKKDEKFIKRQVRLEGTAIQLLKEECLAYYNKQPLFSKIRSHICQQGQIVNWDQLKKKHDDLLKEVRTANKQLPMPEDQVAYKIIPNNFDFYLAWNNCIADRLEFMKQSGNGWEFHHVAA